VLTSNTTSHDDHGDHDYGALLGGPTGCPSSAIKRW